MFAVDLFVVVVLAGAWSAATVSGSRSPHLTNEAAASAPPEHESGTMRARLRR